MDLMPGFGACPGFRKPAFSNDQDDLSTGDFMAEVSVAHNAPFDF
jgi:hypothetical protein